MLMVCAVPRGQLSLQVSPLLSEGEAGLEDFNLPTFTIYDSPFLPVTPFFSLSPSMAAVLHGSGVLVIGGALIKKCWAFFF